LGANFLSEAQVNQGNIHGFNRYAYSNNNPYRYVDPDGRAAESYLNRPQGLSIAEYQSNHTALGIASTFLGAVEVVGCAATPCGVIGAVGTAVGLVNGLTESNVVSSALQGAGVNQDFADGAAAVDLVLGGKAQVDNIGETATKLFTGTGVEVAASLAKSTVDMTTTQATLNENIDKVEDAIIEIEE
jgi:hypothetical protein